MVEMMKMKHWIQAWIIGIILKVHGWNDLDFILTDHVKTCFSTVTTAKCVLPADTYRKRWFRAYSTVDICHEIQILPTESLCCFKIII